MQNWKLKQCKRKTKDILKSYANKVVFRAYTQFTPVVLHTSVLKSSVELTYTETFSEKHYFRSSETKTKSNS